MKATHARRQVPQGQGHEGGQGEGLGSGSRPRPRSGSSNAEALSKAKPSKGEEESWTKLTASYEKSVKALEAGGEKKDAKAVNSALGKINASCGGLPQGAQGQVVGAASDEAGA